LSEGDYWLDDHEKRLDIVDFKTLKARGLSSATMDLDGVFKGLVFFRHETFPMKLEETKTVIECAGGVTTLLRVASFVYVVQENGRVRERTRGKRAQSHQNLSARSFGVCGYVGVWV
jgi:hypothetical protein